MVYCFRVNLFSENQIVGAASRSGQTCQPQKSKKYEIRNLELGEVVTNG